MSNDVTSAWRDYWKLFDELSTLVESDPHKRHQCQFPNGRIAKFSA